MDYSRRIKINLTVRTLYILVCINCSICLVLFPGTNALLLTDLNLFTYCSKSWEYMGITLRNKVSTMVKLKVILIRKSHHFQSNMLVYLHRHYSCRVANCCLHLILIDSMYTCINISCNNCYYLKDQCGSIACFTYTSTKSMKRADCWD